MRKIGHFQLLTAALLLASLAACSVTTNRTDDRLAGTAIRPEAVISSGYACCNLHYEGDLISDANFAQLPFIPAGTRILVRKIEGNRADLEVDGKPISFMKDGGREKESTIQWVNKLVVLEDPRLKIARLTPELRRAIEAGKLIKGMSKEQVILSVGHPQTSQTEYPDSPYWRYWWSSYRPYYVYWSGNKLSKIGGLSETVASMTYKTK